MGLYRRGNLSPDPGSAGQRSANRAYYGSGDSAARIANTSAAFLVTGPGAAGRALPSTLRIGWTSLVVPLRNASSASASAESGMSSSPAPDHSITSARVTPARHPADSGGVRHPPPPPTNHFLPGPPPTVPSGFPKHPPLPPPPPADVHAPPPPPPHPPLTPPP